MKRAWMTALALIIVIGASGASGEIFAAQEAQEAESDGTTEAIELGLSEEEQSYIAWADKFLESIEPQTGHIELIGGQAALNVTENFYFLSAEDSAKLLTEAWGNPPDDSVLGMIFPTGITPLDGAAWGVTISYFEDGWVSDEDAADIDYDDMLSEMKSELASESEMRVVEGYDAIELIGWAAPPYYDATAKKLHWAKEIRFGSSDYNTLNYNIRVLGRRGVLFLNFIANMDQLPEINDNLDAVLEMSEFTEGARYADFDPDIDTVAAYGIGALVAGKLIAKTGFLAVLLVFLKKFGIIILAAGGAFVAKFFRKKKAPTDDNNADNADNKDE